MSEGLGLRPFPVVLAAPSGTGKTTIAHRLVAEFSHFVFSVSATTRTPRPEERPGRDYDFLPRAEFESQVDRGELVEWAEVHGISTAHHARRWRLRQTPVSTLFLTSMCRGRGRSEPGFLTLC